MLTRASFIFAINFLLPIFRTQDTIASYMHRRNKIIKEELKISVGGSITLTKDEQAANEVLMKIKWNLYDKFFEDPKVFTFPKNFLTFVDRIKDTQMHKIIRKMPKGAILHLHSALSLDADSFMKLTYLQAENLYVCYGENIFYRYSISVPTLFCPVQWVLIQKLRKIIGRRKVDTELKKHFTLVKDDENEQNAVNKNWEQFTKVEASRISLISYRPVLEIHFNKVLERAYAENVMYLELRSIFDDVYELNGTVHKPIFTPRLYKSLTKSFIKSHPDFIGIKMIHNANRLKTNQEVIEDIEDAVEINKQLPDMFAGFELSGREDLGRPLFDFATILLEAQKYFNYYFQAGETLWFGTMADENLVDAILLGSKRIGHAYALIKHPNLLKIVTKHDIGLELNVISNGVFGLVKDLREHPLASYIANGLPVVLASDEPGAWGADMITHDFYVTFLAIASRNHDIRLLKQLALNSIKHSALDYEEKQRFYRIFDKRWKFFIEDLKRTKCKACNGLTLRIHI